MKKENTKFLKKKKREIVPESCTYYAGLPQAWHHYHLSMQLFPVRKRIFNILKNSYYIYQELS